MSENIILSMKVGECHAGPPPGSRTGTCDGCLSPVWISPSSDHMAPGWKAMCLQCAVEAAGGDVTQFNVINPTPPKEQLKEMEKVLGKDFLSRY